MSEEEKQLVVNILYKEDFRKFLITKAEKGYSILIDMPASIALKNTYLNSTVVALDTDNEWMVFSADNTGVMSRVKYYNDAVFAFNDAGLRFGGFEPSKKFEVFYLDSYKEDIKAAIESNKKIKHINEDLGLSDYYDYIISVLNKALKNKEVDGND